MHSQHRIVPRPDWLRGPRIIDNDYSKDPQWPCDAPDLPVCVIGDANASRFRKPFQPCRYVHAIPEDVTTVDDDIANIDANAELDPLLPWHIDVALGHTALDGNGAADRVHYAAELSQQPIPGVLDNPPAVLTDLRIHEGAQVTLELGVRALLILAGQAAVASHIGRQDGG
jgi:hypothetical protein